MMLLDLQEFLFRVLLALASTDDIVGAGPQFAAKLPHIGVWSVVGNEADVPAVVVVDVHQRAVDGLYPVSNELLLLVELGGEAGDVPNGVLIEVVLELLLESGQVVLGHALVELAVLRPGLDGHVELRGFLRIQRPKLAHQGNDPLPDPILGRQRLRLLVAEVRANGLMSVGHRSRVGRHLPEL